MTDARELTASEEKQILDAAPDAMVVVDATSVISFVNEQTKRMFGYSEEELIGKKLELLIPERFRGSHATHVSRFSASPVTRPMGSGLELFGRRRDGSEVQIEVSLSPVVTERGRLVAAAIRDISERKRIEGAAKIAADRLASAAETIADSLAIFDSEDRLVMCNAAYRRLFGDCGETLEGKTYSELLDMWLGQLVFASDDEKERFRALRTTDHEASSGASDVRTTDGRSLRLMRRRTPEGGVVLTIWDLTDDVRREEELRQARLAAEAGSAAKSEFLSSMSHELRTPLNAILGFAQLLQLDKKEPLSPRHKDRATQIIKGGEHLLRLIDDILDLSRIEAGRVSISTEPVSVLEVLEELERTLATLAERSGVHLVVAPPPSGSLARVAADRTRLTQILMNFGSNAIKYNRPGGTVTVTLEPRDTMVRVTVADDGIGIPPEKQDKLFQPFQRAGQETGPIEGTGIGLVITKRLAELMGGRVGFDSQPGVGSHFWVELPADGAKALGADGMDLPAAQGLHLAGERKRVLYVEDNPANVAFMRDLMDGFDAIDLFTAPTAEMGIELARRKTPHVILMDINLPGLSGIDALRALRKDPKTSHVPVIALTAAASERDKQRGMQEGFFRYLTKPVKVNELVAALEAILRE